MSASEPSSKLALRHAAICVTDLARSLDFFTRVLGFTSYHTRDKDWMMVQSEGTTLSLLRVGKKDPVSMAASSGAHPAHLGLVATSKEEVKRFHVRLKGVEGINVGTIELHRDGSEGFYFRDFDGNQFECIFIPTEPVTVA